MLTQLQQQEIVKTIRQKSDAREKERRAVRQAYLNQQANSELSGGLFPSIAAAAAKSTRQSSEKSLSEGFPPTQRNAVTISMEQAVNRHYSDLKRLEDQKRLEREDFDFRIKAERDLIAMERKKRQDVNQTLLKSLQ